MDDFSKSFVIAPTQTAKIMGSGDLEVLATPALAAMIENTANELLRSKLQSKETSVGTRLELSHLKPSKVGTTIVVNMTMTEQTGSKNEFTYDVFDGNQKIAAGTHQRVIVLKEPFLKKLEQG